MARKPNHKTWECPIWGKICNTRGVPTYVRNKLGLPWDEEYWHNHSKLMKDYQLKISNQKLLKIKKVLIDKRIPEEEYSEILQNLILEFFWSTRLTYQNKGPLGLSEMLRYMKNYNEIERKKYFDQFNTK